MLQVFPSTSATTFPSPIGSIRVTATETQLIRVDVGPHGIETERADSKTRAGPILREVLAQFTAWFDGRLHEFDLPLDPSHTPRGEAHRAAIRAIGYGATASYGEVARRIDSSPRAVGQACRRNPFPIIIPCHRVIGTGGTLGHYSAGEGIATKSWLLHHEQRRS